MPSWFYHGLSALAFAACLSGCSALTEPPPPELVSVEATPTPPVDGGAAHAAPSASAQAAPPAPQPAGPPEKITSTTLSPGKGAAVASDGDKVRVHYTGTLTDG